MKTALAFVVASLALSLPAQAQLFGGRTHYGGGAACYGGAIGSSLGGSYQFVPDGYVVMKPPTPPPTKRCAFCGGTFEERYTFCSWCGKPFAKEDGVKPKFVTYGQLLRALDEIHSVTVDNGKDCPVPMKVVTVKEKSRFAEWKDIQKDDDGHYVILKQYVPPVEEPAK